MNEPVLCPVSPEMVELLRQPGGLQSAGPVTVWLDADNVITMKESYVLSVLAVGDIKAGDTVIVRRGSANCWTCEPGEA